MDDVTLQVSEALALINETLEMAFPFILVEGEVASFKVNQNKFIFFDLKDSEGSLNCFMMAFALKFPLEDGMKVKVLAQPKITKWGKFSFTIKEVMPTGEGSLKKAFDVLKQKLEAEGLFDESRKRTIPTIPQKIGVISSSGAAGYVDFIKILSNRWGGLEIILADVPVQGIESPAQVVGAITYLNQLPEQLDAIAIVRGGGSVDDLGTFNHDAVVRAIAASRTPTICGVGHEGDISLSDLVADVRAATPSNAAELLVPDKKQLIQNTRQSVKDMDKQVTELIQRYKKTATTNIDSIYDALTQFIAEKQAYVVHTHSLLSSLSPQAALQRGYSVVRTGKKVVTRVGDVTMGEEIAITVFDGEIGAKVL